MSEPEQFAEEREGLLEQLEGVLEGPLIALGFVWLALIVVDLVCGLRPLLAGPVTLIWIVFILDFVLRLWVAPSKPLFLQRNWPTAISLVLPALRALAVVRLALRGARLVNIVGSLSPGMSALRKSMLRRGFGCVVALTTLVTVVGAAGLYAPEGPAALRGGLTSYGEAFWSAAMIMTTLGSQYVVQTAEGRILTLVLAAYAFAVFGYFYCRTGKLPHGERRG